MQTELATLRGLWNKAATPSAKARLLAGFSEDVRRELYRQTGDVGLLEGLADGNRDHNGADSSQAAAVSGPLQFYILGQLEVKTFEQRVEKARRRAEKRMHKRAVTILAAAYKSTEAARLDLAAQLLSI